MEINQLDDDFTQDKYRIPYHKQEEWKIYLKKNGFVVLQGFLQPQLCSNYVQQFWAIMETLSRGKINRQDKQTRSLKDNYPPLLHGGMIQYIGHSKPQWELRQKAKVIFQKIWKTQQLKTSFDGFCFMNGQLKFEQRPLGTTLHTDQSPTKNHLWSYQGIMTLTDANENGGGFVCVPKSHDYHQQFFKKINRMNHNKDWFSIPEEQKLVQPLCNVIKVNNKAGDFILFDSRTFHCNTCPSTDSLRVCTYICMIPEKKITEQILQLRKMACQNKATSSHHPGSGFRTFPVLPPRKMDDSQKFLQLIKEVNSFQLTQNMKKLV